MSTLRPSVPPPPPPPAARQAAQNAVTTAGEGAVKPPPPPPVRAPGTRISSLPAEVRVSAVTDCADPELRSRILSVVTGCADPELAGYRFISSFF